MSTNTSNPTPPNCFKQFTAMLYAEEEGGYSVYCKEIPGAISMGDDEEHAMQMIREATELLLEDYPHPIPWRKQAKDHEADIAEGYYERAFHARVPCDLLNQEESP